MAQQAKALIDTLLDRVRDPEGMATTRAQALNLVSRSQQTINSLLDDVVVSTLFTVPPYTQIFPIASILTGQPQPVRILAVKDAAGRDLFRLGSRADLESYWVNLYWFTEQGDELDSWGTVGRGLLVLRPALAAQQVVTVLYTQLTPTLAVEGDSTLVPPEDDQAILDLGELLIRMKSRDFGDMKGLFERFKTRVTALKESER